MEESRFTTSFDGARIAYRVYGEGSPTVLLSNGIGCNQVYLDYLIRDLQKHYRTVIWDYRGHVDSEKPSDAKILTIDCFMRDMLAVMEAAEIGDAVLGGFSMGTQVCLEFYSRFPERVLGLLALCGPYEHPLKTFFHVGPLADALYPLLLREVNRNPERAQRVWSFMLSGPWVFSVARLLVLNRKAVKREDFERYRPHIANMDILTFFQTGACFGQHTAKSVLPRIDVPTLVVAGDEDNFTPVSVCRRMYEMIPTAEWYLVKGGSHGSLIKFPDEINSRVLKFMARHF